MAKKPVIICGVESSPVVGIICVFGTGPESTETSLI